MEKIEKKIIKFTQDLVKIPSQAGINSEERIAKFIFKKLKSFGFSPKIIGSRKHPSVICFIRKFRSKKTIWLESHIDTAPVGDLSNWKYPPFKGVIKNGRMYGRGVADAKTGISLFSYLAKVLYENKEFKGNIFLIFDADEESGNFTGIKEILKIAPRGDICILGYQKREISIGGRGWLRIRLITFGRPAHTGSRTKKGINAIHRMQKAIDSILKSSFLKKKEKFFEYGNSLNVSLIKGGEAINVVPDKCEALIDIRFSPSFKKESIMKEILERLNKIKKLDKEFKFKIEILQAQKPFFTNPDHPFIKILKEEAEKIFKEKIPLVTSGGGSVGNLISQRKIPILNVFGCNCGNVHAPNEWINIRDIPKVFEVYKNSLIRFSKI